MERFFKLIYRHYSWLGNKAREQGILVRAVAQAQESVQIVTGKSIKIIE